LHHPGTGGIMLAQSPTLCTRINFTNSQPIRTLDSLIIGAHDAGLKLVLLPVRAMQCGSTPPKPRTRPLSVVTFCPPPRLVSLPRSLFLSLATLCIIFRHYDSASPPPPLDALSAVPSPPRFDP